MGAQLIVVAWNDPWNERKGVTDCAIEIEYRIIIVQ